MGNVKEKVAYLQGLTAGLNVSETSAEGKLLLQIIDVLDDFAVEFERMSASQDDLADYVETIDEDLNDLEEDMYVDSDFDEPYHEVECPKCHDTVLFESSLLEGDDPIEVTCPSCGVTVYQSDKTDDRDFPPADEHYMNPGL